MAQHSSHKSSGRIAAWFRSLPSMLSPSAACCIYCGETSPSRPEYLGLCRACYQAVPWIRQVVCPTCGRYEDCPDCRRRATSHFVLNRSAVRYDQAMKNMLARYKYRGDEKLCEAMASMLGYAYTLVQRASPASRQAFELLTYVPLSRERLAERGFNQAELLARQLGKRLRLPVADLLERTRHTDKQSLKSRSARLQDLEKVFAARIESFDALPAHAQYRIYVVDDVYTTGSTLQQCAQTITEALPSAWVFGLTWAR